MLHLDCFKYITKNNKKRYILLNDREFSNKDFIEIELPSGSCMLMDKSLMKQIGNFDPQTFLYFEENILYKKISRIGLKNYLIPSCRCIHIGASSTQKTRSTFIAMTGLRSTNYYLKNYTTLSFIQRLCWELAMFLFKSKLFIAQILKKQ